MVNNYFSYKKPLMVTGESLTYYRVLKHLKILEIIWTVFGKLQNKKCNNHIKKMKTHVPTGDIVS